MFDKLKPTFEISLVDSNLLWFEISNKYVILEKSLYNILIDYIDCKEKDTFALKLCDKTSISQSAATSIVSQLKLLLSDCHTKPRTGGFIPKTIIKDTTKLLCKVYQFNNVWFSIGYPSKYIKDLIHPQIAHLSQGDDNHEVSNTLEIYEVQDQIHLVLNKKNIASYSQHQIHFLEGKVALCILNFLYEKNENDWLATIHGSAVSNGRESLLIVGRSGSGKSTLTALLELNGLIVLADDFTPLLRLNQEFYNYPNAISIKEGAFKVLDKISPNLSSMKEYLPSSKDVKVKYLVPKISCGTPKHYPCSKIILVNFDAEAKDCLKPAKASDVLSELIPDSWINPNPGDAHAFMCWLKTVSFYQLNYKCNDFAVENIRSLLET